MAGVVCIGIGSAIMLLVGLLAVASSDGPDRLVWDAAAGQVGVAVAASGILVLSGVILVAAAEIVRAIHRQTEVIHEAINAPDVIPAEVRPLTPRGEDRRFGY
jgi:hypothetical protein